LIERINSDNYMKEIHIISHALYNIVY